MSRLEVLSPPMLDARRDLTTRTLLIGRSPDADWLLDEPTVSRRHALVHHFVDHDEIEDLGSTGGTRVNGRTINGPVRLRAGDRVQLAGVELGYVADGAPWAAAGTRGSDARRSVEGAGTFTVRDQQGGTISNVGHDQYNQYVQQVVVQREDALAQVAGMNRFARVLVTIGFTLAGAGVLGFIGSIVVSMAASLDDPWSGPDFPEVAGVPVFAAAMGVALVGFAVYLAGFVVQVSARKQRRQVDLDYPLPQAWPGSDQGGA
jgi:hypothetical protein